MIYIMFCIVYNCKYDILKKIFIHQYSPLCNELLNMEIF